VRERERAISRGRKIGQFQEEDDGDMKIKRMKDCQTQYLFGTSS